MIDILDRLKASSKVNGAYPRDIQDAILEIENLRVLKQTVQRYLKECIEDEEDRWITRESLHKLCS